MRKIKGLYKLSRPLTSLSGVLAVFLGGYVAGTGAWGKITLAALATMLIAAAANAWNDYLDVEIDKINQPQRPLPAGIISLTTARNFSFVLAILSVFVAAFISRHALIVVLASNTLLYFYSLRMKSTILMGNAIVAFISAMSAVFGGMAAGNIMPTFWLALIIVTGIMGREVLKTMADYEGDLRQQVRTVATAWGRQPARIIFLILVIITLVMMMTPYLFNVYRPIYAITVLLGVYPVILYVMIRAMQVRNGRQLERLSQLMKYDFLVWFLAVVLGTA